MSDPSAAHLPRHTTRGRGTAINPPSRFERVHVELDPAASATDWGDDPTERPAPSTQFFFDDSASILSRNDSPDVPYTFGLNPYRGCEHGCAYCFARPYHNYLGWSSGLDFETKILVKRRAPALLRDALSKPSWQPEPVAFSGATDCYQPCERHFRLTRQCLEVALELRNPVALITKNRLITRDLDLFTDFAAWNGAAVLITMTSLDPDLAGRLEPRAARPSARLDAISRLAGAGVPVGVMIAPIVPGLTDHEIPAILQAAANAGARSASRIVLRLPHDVKTLFTDWLDTHYPGKKDRVLSRIREIRGGELNVTQWRTRMRGEGPHAESIHHLFEVSRRRAGLAPDLPELNTTAFRPPGGTQLDLL
ncbi:PA0069 family radical SAM protein [Actomonas aquatica]|uniref:PA0069 family radical SAM protein n=1 Tax=Actomonas aquatica TaxID=2866162 RepID=A0ABZ1C4Q7_9BACT|nr:PA0069 family radical SAM protein [Opitutus sp. WL0086]WRQ86481.1 PA0069 family radical SAM protein [Opitutus sp. WL0086]